jgi:predicted aldo/keto reductase-like oxidoreductase
VYRYIEGVIIMQTVTLRRTGLKMSRLGFGTGTHGWNGSSEETRIGHQNLVNLMRLGYEHGITFWDSADGYGSHPHLADALEGIDRSSVTILTKSFSKSPDEIRNDIKRYLKELRTDYIDILLMHCISDPDWLRKYTGAIEALKEARDKGIVKGIGMSCHALGALKTVASADWIDVILARINYDGINTDGKPYEVMPVLKDIYDAGKDILAMKVIGQGKLNADVPKCMKFILSLPYIDAITIGMTSEAQLLQNVSLLNEYTSNANASIR